MELKFTVQIKIQKPVAEVFDGVYNPHHLSQYFTTAGASAPMDEGTTVMWEFADFPGAFPVRVGKVVKNKSIAMDWDAGEGVQGVTLVEMKFEAIDEGSTLVSITESGWPATEKGLTLSYGNCQGWAQMQSCLKAYLEYGINLRKGAY